MQGIEQCFYFQSWTKVVLDTLIQTLFSRTTQIINLRGDLTNISAEKEAQASKTCMSPDACLSAWRIAATILTARDGIKQYTGSGISGTVLSKWYPETCTLGPTYIAQRHAYLWQMCTICTASKPSCNLNMILCTVSPLSIQTKAFFSACFRRDAEWQREKIWCHSVRTIKVLRMQPSDGEYDIIWRSYMSVKFAKRLNT